MSAFNTNNFSTNGYELPASVGASLKPEHFASILHTPPPLGFFEIHAENYLVAGGPFHHYLTQIRQNYPLSIHGVGLSLGGQNPPNLQHLTALKSLIDRYQPAVFSEHLAWSNHGNHFLNDLLPLAYNQQALNRICAHIEQVQQFLGRQILLENPSTYVEFTQSTFTEAEFISALVERTGCGLLLDLNNLYVSCRNHNWEIQPYIRALPLAAVREIHLAGFHREIDPMGEALFIDSHDAQVDDAVWALYKSIIQQLGPIPTLIEWDNNLPPFSDLLAEVQLAQTILDAYNTLPAKAQP
jgi:uncharacterized protein (UPF0276 family)